MYFGYSGYWKIRITNLFELSNLILSEHSKNVRSSALGTAFSWFFGLTLLYKDSKINRWKNAKQKNNIVNHQLDLITILVDVVGDLLEQKESACKL